VQRLAHFAPEEPSYGNDRTFVLHFDVNHEKEKEQPYINSVVCLEGSMPQFFEFDALSKGNNNHDSWESKS